MYIAVIADHDLIAEKKKIEKRKNRDNKDSKGSTSSASSESSESGDLPEEDFEEYLDSKTTSPLIRLEEALKSYDNTVEFLYPDDKLFSLLQMGKFDLILNTTNKMSTQMHPAQYVALFDIVGIPFVGSNMGAIYLCKYKALFKSLLKLNLIATPPFQILKIQGGKFPPIRKTFQFPVILKFFSEGIHLPKIQDQVANTSADVKDILTDFAKKHQFSSVLVEEFIIGRRLYLPLMGNDLNDSIHFLPALEYQYPTEISFDNQKALAYSDLEVKFLEMTDPVVSRARKVARKVYTFCNCRDYAMAVFFWDEKNNNLLLHELNPMSSLLLDSKFMTAAGYVGLSYHDMVNDIILAALERYGIKIRGKYAKRLKKLNQE